MTEQHLPPDREDRPSALPISIASADAVQQGPLFGAETVHAGLVQAGQNGIDLRFLVPLD